MILFVILHDENSLDIQEDSLRKIELNSRDLIIEEAVVSLGQERYVRIREFLLRRFGLQ